MKILKKITECKPVVNNLKKKCFIIGFVPTMGFLHDGHLSLIRMAREACDRVFISIFVNPIQFGPGEDFEKYPRDMKRDISLAEKEGVDYLFYPTEKEMYAPDFKTSVEVKELGSIMCGKYRPGHFAGVTTVVLKLLNIVRPDKAYFGEKDLEKIRKVVITDLGKNRFVKKVDYFDFRDPRTLDHLKRVDKDGKNILAATAVWIGRARLVD